MRKCFKCLELKSFDNFHKDKNRPQCFAYECKICISKRFKEYSKKNKEKRSSAHKKYYEANVEKIYKRTKAYKDNRYKNDLLFRLLCVFRCHTRRIMEGYSIKSKTTKQILGADIEVVKKHLENLFQKGMSWNNYGKWEIDHIIPLSSAKTKKQAYKLGHYKNLQPLWVVDNRKKSAKLFKQESGDAR